MAVRRFRAGSGQLTSSESSQFRRGQQPQRPIQENISANQSQLQQERIQSEIERAREELRLLEERQIQEGLSRTERRNVQVGLYGVKARLTYLESAQQGLSGGAYYQDFNQVTQGSQQAEDNAKQAARDQIKVGIRNRKERKEEAIAAKEIAKEEARQTGYQDLGDGLFSIGGRVFTQEGKEVQLQSTYQGIKGFIVEDNNFKQASPFPKPGSFAGVQGGVYTSNGLNLLEYESKPLIVRVGIGIGKAAVSVSDFLGRTVQSQGTVLLKKEDISSEKGLAGLKNAFLGSYKKFETPKVSYLRNAPTSVSGIREGFIFTNIALASASSFQIANQGIKATITSLSPFKIKPGYYGALETGKDLKFDVVSITKQKGDTTFKLVKGRETTFPDTKIISKQTFRTINEKTIGVAKTTIRSPVTYVSPSGEISTGIRTLNYKSFIKPIGEGKVLSSGKLYKLTDLEGGFVAQTLTSKKYEIVNVGKIKTIDINLGFNGKKSLIGGVNLQGEKGFTFLAGRGIKGLNIKKGLISTRVSKINIRGIEFKLPETTTTSFTSSTRALRLSKPDLLTKLSFQQLSAASLEAKPISFKTDTKIIPIVSRQKVSTAQRQVTIQQPKQEQNVKTLQINLLSPRVEVTQKPRTLSITSTSQSQEPLTRLRLIQSPVSSTRQLTQRVQLQKSKIPGGVINFTPTITQPTKPTGFFLYSKRYKQPKPSKGFFTVFLRRYGKFKPIATTRTQQEAFNIGTRAAATTLAATFKVTGVTNNYKTPKGFKKQINKKEGALFIELPKFRLSTATEVKELQRARRR